MQRRTLIFRWILFVHFLLVAIRFFNEGVRVKLPCKIFDRRDDARRGAIYGVADYRVAMIAYGSKNPPCGQVGKAFDSRWSRL